MGIALITQGAFPGGRAGRARGAVIGRGGGRAVPAGGRRGDLGSRGDLDMSGWAVLGKLRGAPREQDSRELVCGTPLPTTGLARSPSLPGARHREGGEPRPPSSVLLGSAPHLLPRPYPLSPPPREGVRAPAVWHRLISRDGTAPEGHVPPLVPQSPGVTPAFLPRGAAWLWPHCCDVPAASPPHPTPASPSSHRPSDRDGALHAFRA